MPLHTRGPLEVEFVSKVDDFEARKEDDRLKEVILRSLGHKNERK